MLKKINNIIAIKEPVFVSKQSPAVSIRMHAKAGMEQHLRMALIDLKS
jgi:hypothetical protein